MSTPETSSASSGRRWTARILLIYAGLWAVGKIIEVMLARSSFATAQALDFTNPSLLGILAFGSVIAYFFVRPRGQIADTAKPVEYAPVSKTTCDQCKKSFPSSYYLMKSQDNRYLCKECQTEPSTV